MNEVQVHELCPNCKPAIEKKAHICIGVSPFNSLFSEDYLIQLVDYCKSNFDSFHLFIPDLPTIHTLEAIGYDKDKATKKMKKQVKWLKNKVRRALKANAISEEKASQYIIDASHLERSEIFKKELQLVEERYENDQEFRKLCLEASKWVLENHVKDKNIEDKQLEIAVKYFLFELPMFAATNKIVGKETSLFCYHQAIDFHEKLYAKQLSYLPQAGQGYGLISLNN